MGCVWVKVVGCGGNNQFQRVHVDGALDLCGLHRSVQSEQALDLLISFPIASILCSVPLICFVPLKPRCLLFCGHVACALHAVARRGATSGTKATHTHALCFGGGGFNVVSLVVNFIAPLYVSTFAPRVLFAETTKGH